MTTSKTLKIAFVSSSDFCIPIANALLAVQGKTFNQLIDNHLIGLNKTIYTVDNTSFKIVNHYNYQDVKTSLGEINNWPIELILVVSQPDNLNRNKIAPSPISLWAAANNISLWKPENINKENSEIFESLDLVVTASFGQLISQSLLAKPKYGFINWHPSLLPKYRGPTPMQSTIVNQEKQYGLSWITMTKAMDAGKILLQLESDLELGMDFDTMASKLGQLGSDTLTIAMLNQILNVGNEQDENEATFCKKIERQEQLIRIDDLTARQIMAQHKAFIRFPGTVFEDEYFGGKIKIMDCKVLQFVELEDAQVLTYQNWNVIKTSKNQLAFIECKDKTLLQINKIKTSTGKLVDLSGYQFK